MDHTSKKRQFHLFGRPYASPNLEDNLFVGKKIESIMLVLLSKQSTGCAGYQLKSCCMSPATFSSTFRLFISHRASLEKGKAKAVEPVGGDETEPEDDDDDPEELVLPLGWSVRTLLDEVNRMLVRSGAEPYTYPMTWKRTGARPTEGSILESRQPPSEKKTELDMDDDAAATLSAMTSGRGSSTAHPSARVNAVSGPSNTQSASSFTSSSTGFFGFSIRSSNAQTAGPSNSQSNAYASRSAALPSSSSNAENSGPSGQVGGTTRLAASQSTPQPGPSQVSAAGLSNDMVDDLFENDENQPPPPPQPATIPPSQVGPTPSSSFGGDRARGVPQSQVGSSANVATSSPIPTFLPPTPLSRLSMPGVAKGQCKSNEDDRHDALSQAASQHASSFTFIPAQPSFQPAESGSFVTASASGEPMQMEEDPWTPWWANGQDDTMEGIDDDFQMMDGTQIVRNDLSYLLTFLTDINLCRITTSLSRRLPASLILPGYRW